MASRVRSKQVSVAYLALAGEGSAGREEQSVIVAIAGADIRAGVRSVIARIMQILHVCRQETAALGFGSHGG